MSIHDAGVAGELAGNFLDDLESAQEYDLERWKARPVHSRAYEYLGEILRQPF